MLIAGKGHEDYQEAGGVRTPFSDAREVEAALATMERLMMDTGAVSAILGARLVGASVPFTRVTTDTRTLQRGDLFVALAGERFDGHDFVAAAFERGAAAALVADARADALGGNLVAVPDPLAALARLAAHWRRQFALPVAVIVGSNGKTTVKEMLAAILRAAFGDDAVLATQGNLNNSIGLPLTVLGLRAHHRAAAIELGMNHPGETASLAAVAQPTVAVVNNAQREHQEFMRTVADVAAEHAALPRALPAGGVAVLNADDAFVGVWRDAVAPGAAAVEFALDHPAAVRGRHTGATGALDLATPAGDFTVHLGTRGRHNAANALAAATAALAMGVPRRRGGARPRGVPPGRRAPGCADRFERRRRHRRHLQRQSGFGARGHRRARRRAAAALAGAGRHGRSRGAGARLPPRGRRVRARGRHREALLGRPARRRGGGGVRPRGAPLRLGRG